MSDSYRAALVKWLPTVALGSILVLAALGGVQPTIGALFVVAIVQGLWIAVPKAAYRLGGFIAARRNGNAE